MDINNIPEITSKGNKYYKKLIGQDLGAFFEEPESIKLISDEVMHYAVFVHIEENPGLSLNKLVKEYFSYAPEEWTSAEAEIAFRKAFNELLNKEYLTIKVKPATEREERELTEETMEASPYAELLRKYTEDEIFDIAAGKKEATEEEVTQAKEVITRGIVSSRLSMRKKAQKGERKELANKSSNPETLAELAKDEDVWVRMGVATNSNTPPETLAELAKDKDKDIRGGVAGNVHTPPETLVELAKDEDGSVRWNVAWNKNTPPETLAELAKDKDETIRYNVAANPNTSSEILAELTKDKDEYVSYKAVENPNTPKETIPKFEQHITDLFDQILMEREAEFPPEFLEELEIEPETVVPAQPPLTKELIISKVLELLAKEHSVSKLDKRTEFKAMKILRKIFREQEIELAEETGETPPLPISEVEEQEELTEEKVEVPYADLLNKYTTDEIFDIAAGRKTDVTEEEVIQAKDVIQRGIVSNRLSMRKRKIRLSMRK